MRRIGVVVNPVAGMGGRVGLKGTDGKVDAARERGADPRSRARAAAALRALSERAPDAEILTCGEPMGESVVRDAGFDPVVVGSPGGAPPGEPTPEAGDAFFETTADDTRDAVREFVAADVDLVLFVGGDGTAVDVLDALERSDADDEDGGPSDVPMLGVPAGVKVYSAVFAVTPEAAGRVAADFDRTERREVNDIDEEAYREGEVQAELKGVASVPVAEDLQSSKQVGGGTVESLAAGVADDVEPGVTYVLGPGSTVGAVKAGLGFEGSPLGVDVYRDGEVLVEDASADEILAHLGDPEAGERNVVVVSPIGGQGFVFGRGNDQLSPAVLRESDVEIVASKRKLDDVGVLRVDTGDAEVDESLRGWWKVRVGRFEHRMMKLV